jgi:hypothetical protein
MTSKSNYEVRAKRKRWLSMFKTLSNPDQKPRAAWVTKALNIAKRSDLYIFWVFYLFRLIIYLRNMENTLEEKQSYLRKEILEGGLDGNKFMVFLNKSNPKRGEDLDQWSLEELVGIVEAFKPAKNK